MNAKVSSISLGEGVSNQLPVGLANITHRLALEIFEGLGVNSGTTIPQIQKCLDGAVSYSSDGVEDFKDYYSAAVKFLIDSRVAKPILATDWSVDRIGAANKSLGCKEKGVSILQSILARKYDPSHNFHHIHLHKGPGNGRFPHVLRNEERGKKSQDEIPFMQIGIGDSLYFTVEDILLRVLRTKKIKANRYFKAAINILSQIIQVELRKRWYDSDKSNYAVGEWKMRESASFDLNEIYAILADLQQGKGDQMIEEIFSAEEGTIKQSQIFEKDEEVLIDIEIWAALLLLLGKSPQQIQGIFGTRLQKIGKKLTDIQSEFSQANSAGYEGILKEEGEEKLRLYRQYKEKITQVIRSFMGSGNFPHEWFSDTFDEKGGIVSWKGLFSDAFLQGYEHFNARTKQRERISSKGQDLNELPLLYIQDFVKGYFTNIPKIFKDYPFMLISAVRSDSHENDKHFYRDIERNLLKLAHGGVLISDGINESFTGVSRLHLVRDVLKGKEQDYDTGVIFDEREKKIKSILIQRKSKLGYISSEEKSEFLSEDTRILSIDDALNLAGVYIENKLRMFIIMLGSGKIETTDSFQEAEQAYRQMHAFSKSEDMRQSMLEKAKGVQRLRGMHKRISRIVNYIAQKSGVSLDQVLDATMKEVIDDDLLEIRQYL